MDATQMISDSILASDEEDNEEETENKRGRPLAKLCILKNKHIPETEFPLFLGDNVLGRDPNSCTLPLPASSVSKQHATICLSVYRRHGYHSEVDMEALVWDLGSMNGTRKGRLKLTPNVRYALSDGDSLVVADIPCHFVSCGVDPSQGDTRTPVRRNSGVQPRLPDASGEKGDDTSTDSNKCVNGGAETPVRTSCLTFEQTPHQPQGTLVPESDSDSDSEKGGRGERRPKALVSDSDSHKSSPSCSSFLSPQTKIVPESEDESPITPSSSKNKPNRYGSFITEETDVDVARQQLEKKKAVAVVEDSEEEEGRENERAAQGGTESTKGEQRVPVKKESSASLTGDNELSTPAVSTDAIPAFNMDSDTDVEGEEEGVASAGTVTLNTNQQVDQPPNTVQFHMNSDTDIDKDDDASGKAPKSLPSPDKNAKTSHVVPVIQPEAITMDSDTDVDDDDDDDAVVSDAATKTEPTLFQSAQTDDSAPSVQPKDFHLDSDTDVDEKEEEEAGECGTKNETNEAPNKLDAKLTAPKSANVAPDSLQLESDTDDEAFPATSKPSVVVAVAESRATADAGADLEIRSDSDTDVEDESPLVIPVAVTTLSVSPSPTSEAFQADSDADTDVDESSAPPAGGEANADDLRVDGDAEDRKSDIGEAGEDQIPRLHKENTPGLLAPLLQNCSTPVQMSEGEVEDMETQAFTSPASGAFRRAAVPAVRPVVLSPCSDSQEDEDFAVAETQSFTFQSRDRQSSEEPTQAFVLETSCDNKNDRSTRGESFQLGLSDSSHLRCPDGALAMESTQAFVSVEGGVNLEDTQAYADILAADGSSAENDLNLEAAQDHEEHEETEKCSVVSEKEGQVDLALEATQAYITDLHSDPEDDTDEDETQNMATSETKPSDFATSSTLAIAETQPMLPIVEDDSLATENPVCSVQQIEPRPQKEDGTKAAQPQEKPLSDAQSVTETQPMCMSDNEESDEDSFPAQRKRTANKLPVKKVQTCDLTCSELSLSETQPMAACEDDDEDSMPGPRKRKAKQLHLEEEETQQLTNSELSAAEPQRMTTCEDDDEDSMPGPRKRKAKQLHLDEEETQPLASSEVSALETQPLGTCEVQQSDEEDGIACPRKRKTKPLQLEEEQTQPLTSTDVETLAGVTGKSKKSDDVASVLGPQKRKAKQIKLKEEETQKLVKSDVSAIETRPLKTKTRLSSSEESEVGTSGACVPNLRVTRAKLREEEEQAECSAHSKRQTRGRRGKPLSDDDNKEKVKQAKQVRGKKMKQQKHDGEEEDENPGRERNKHAASKSLIKEQEEGKMREEKDAADLRQERENDKERSIDEREREQDEMERQHRTEDDKLENERRANEQERLQDEKNARAEGEEKPEREIKEKEERIGSEKLETEVERLERERKEQEKEMAKRELIERLEREEKEEREKLEKEKEAKEKELQEKREEQDKSKTPARGRRAARRTIASQCTTEPEQDSTVSTNDDFPARRTRSRSNSSNSVSSERSASSVSTQDSKGRGRGRGRGTKRTSEPPQTPISRSSHRRTTVAAGTTEQESNSSISLNSEISSCSVSFQNRGRGGRQRGRGRKTEHDPDSIPSISQSQSDHKSTPITTARGRKSKKAEDCSNDAVHEDDKQDSQPAATTRGRRQASAATDEKEQSKQACATDESLISKSNVRGRGQRAVKSETVVRPVAPTVSDGDEAKDKRKGRRELEVKAGTDFRCSKGKEKSPKTETAEEEGRDETKGEIPASLQGKKRGRASTTQAKKNAKESVSEGEEKESEEMEVETVKKKVRGRPSVVSRKKKEELEESETSLIGTNQDANVEASEQPQTPTSNVSRKRQAPANSSPMAKTPCSSSASPAASPRLRAASQAYKVLFTGVVDEAGEKVLARLGGSMAKGVADMTCLVTDKVRRTVKFLCALAKGVPIVTTDWLEKSGKAGSFLSPTAFIVKDPEQENKFNFSLHESLRIASSQPLLEGYEVHVTKSVKPEPVHMKNIISSSGATFLPKMPSSNKPHTVVISCEEDWPLCRPALSASLPVVTAEFILTGILQQKLDFQSHTLSLSTANVQPAGGRGRGRRQT